MQNSEPRRTEDVQIRTIPTYTKSDPRNPVIGSPKKEEPTPSRVNGYRQINLNENEADVDFKPGFAEQGAQ
jgi:hypothetical protein